MSTVGCPSLDVGGQAGATVSGVSGESSCATNGSRDLKTSTSRSWFPGGLDVPRDWTGRRTKASACLWSHKGFGRTEKKTDLRKHFTHRRGGDVPDVNSLRVLVESDGRIGPLLLRAVQRHLQRSSMELLATAKCWGCFDFPSFKIKDLTWQNPGVEETCQTYLGGVALYWATLLHNFRWPNCWVVHTLPGHDVAQTHALLRRHRPASSQVHFGHSFLVVQLDPVVKLQFDPNPNFVLLVLHFHDGVLHRVLCDVLELGTLGGRRTKALRFGQTHLALREHQVGCHVTCQLHRRQACSFAHGSSRQRWSSNILVDQTDEATKEEYPVVT